MEPVCARGTPGVLCYLNPRTLVLTFTYGSTRAEVDVRNALHDANCLDRVANLHVLGEMEPLAIGRSGATTGAYVGVQRTDAGGYAVTCDGIQFTAATAAEAAYIRAVERKRKRGLE